MTTAKLSGAGPDYPQGAVKVTLTSYSPTCIPTIHYRLAGSSEVTYTTPFVVKETATVEFWANDLSGNVEAHKFVEVKVPADYPYIALNAPSAVVTYPSIVMLTATTSHLTDTAITIQSRRIDQSMWTTLGSVSSPTNEFVYLAVANFGFYYRAVAGDAMSNEVLVKMKVPLSKPNASATSVKLGRKLVLSGTIRPAHPVGPHEATTKFLLQWQKRNALTKKWPTASSETSISMAAAVNNITTKWTYTTTGKSVGRWRARFVHECPRHERSYSAWREYDVVK